MQSLPDHIATIREIILNQAFMPIVCSCVTVIWLILFLIYKQNMISQFIVTLLALSLQIITLYGLYKLTDHPCITRFDFDKLVEIPNATGYFVYTCSTGGIVFYGLVEEHALAVIVLCLMTFLFPCFILWLSAKEQAGDNV